MTSGCPVSLWKQSRVRTVFESLGKFGEKSTHFHNLESLWILLKSWKSLWKFVNFRICLIMARNAPDCTDLHLEFKNFPGGHAPKPPNPLDELAPMVLRVSRLRRSLTTSPSQFLSENVFFPVALLPPPKNNPGYAHGLLHSFGYQMSVKESGIKIQKKLWSSNYEFSNYELPLQPFVSLELVQGLGLPPTSKENKTELFVLLGLSYVTRADKRYNVSAITLLYKRQITEKKTHFFKFSFLTL